MATSFHSPCAAKGVLLAWSLGVGVNMAGLVGCSSERDLDVQFLGRSDACIPLMPWPSDETALEDATVDALNLRRGDGLGCEGSEGNLQAVKWLDRYGFKVLAKVALAGDSNEEAYKWLVDLDLKVMALLAKKIEYVKLEIEEKNNDIHRFNPD